jgi:hypothetical protein
MCDICSTPATHRCTSGDRPRVFCETHASACCMTFAAYRARLRSCAAPGCSSTMPAKLDERGPLGWHDLVIVMRPLGEGFSPQREFRARLCPACSAERTVVAAIAAAELLG